MRVLVTGSQGFIGKNLVVRLRELPGYEVVTFERGDALSSLVDKVRQADAVVHLAGENRPKDAADFENAMFLGISYTVNAFDPAFSLNAGFVDTSDAYFSYTPIHGIAGYGSVTFTPKPVPLPPSLWLVLGGLAGLVGFESRAKPSMFRTPYAKMTVTPTGNANSAAG